MRKHIRTTFRAPDDTRLSPYEWHQTKTEPSQIDETVKWLENSVRPLSITDEFLPLGETSILDSDAVISSKLRLRCTTPGMATLSGQPDIYLMYHSNVIGFVELKRLARDAHKTKQPTNYLTALACRQGHPVFGVATDLGKVWRF